MIVKRGNNKPKTNPIQLQHIEIEEASTYKYLGYNFNNKDNLSTHIEEQKKKVEANPCNYRQSKLYLYRNGMYLDPAQHMHA